MIELYTGTPGSGKSLHIAKVIREWIEEKGAPVIGNFAFRAGALNAKKWGSYLEVSNDFLEPDFCIYFSETYKELRGWDRVPEEHILMVIDEAQIIYNARSWSTKNRAGWISFYTQHRKMGYHIVMIAQFDMMIDKQIRALIEYEWIHRKVSNIGKSGKLLNAAGGGGLHAAVKIYKPLGEKVGSMWIRGDSVLYCLYDSYTRFETGSS